MRHTHRYVLGILGILVLLNSACVEEEPDCPGIFGFFVEEGPMAGGFFEHQGRLLYWSFGGKGARWNLVLPDGRLGDRIGTFYWADIEGGVLDIAENADGRIRLVASQYVYRVDVDGSRVESAPLIADASPIPAGFRLRLTWRVEGELYGLWSHETREATPYVATVGLALVGEDDRVVPLGEPLYRYVEGDVADVDLWHPRWFSGGWAPDLDLFEVVMNRDGYDLLLEVDRGGAVLSEREVTYGYSTTYRTWQRMDLPAEARVREESSVVLADTIWSMVDPDSGLWILFNELGDEWVEVPFLEPREDPIYQLDGLTQYRTSDGELWFAAPFGEEIIIRRWDPTIGDLTPEARSSALGSYCDEGYQLSRR